MDKTIQIFMDNKQFEINQIPKDYNTLIKLLNNSKNINENYILCFDWKETFIINEENSFKSWKDNINCLGNCFLIINQPNKEIKASDILARKKIIYSLNLLSKS